MGWTLFGALGIASIVGFLAVWLAATPVAPGTGHGMMGWGMVGGTSMMVLLTLPLLLLPFLLTVVYILVLDDPTSARGM